MKFNTKINISFVNQSNGWVDSSEVSLLKNWNKSNTLHDALTAIRKEMESNNFKKLKQPEEFTYY